MKVAWNGLLAAESTASGRSQRGWSKAAQAAGITALFLRPRFAHQEDLRRARRIFKNGCLGTDLCVPAAGPCEDEGRAQPEASRRGRRAIHGDLQGQRP